MENAEVIQSTRKEIKRQLSKCTKESTPKIYELIQSPEGYRKIESMIIFTLIYGQTSIGAAIAQVEMEML